MQEVGHRSSVVDSRKAVLGNAAFGGAEALDVAQDIEGAADAHFDTFSNAEEEVIVELSVEDAMKAGGYVGRLEKSIHGDMKATARLNFAQFEEHSAQQTRQTVFVVNGNRRRGPRDVHVESDRVVGRQTHAAAR